MNSQSLIDLNHQKYAFELHSETELLNVFRKKDKEKVVLPRAMKFPVRVRFYHAWTEPSGVYTYLIFKKSGWEAPRGVVFKRGATGSHNSPTRLCDWCHAYGRADQIGMMRVVVNPKVTLGMMICLDLSCEEKLESMANIAGRSLEELTDRMCERIGQFFEKSNLGS